MTTRLRAWWLLGALLFLVGVGVAARVWMRGPQVDVIEVHRAPLVRTLQFSARLATLSRVDIGSTLNGRVAIVRVREGDAVKVGGMLVQLEDDELRAALACRRGSVRAGNARAD